MAVHLFLGDIVKMETDAIVNAASTDLRPQPGICAAIFAAADTEALKKECKKIRHCPIGRAAVTSGCGLPAKYIIHVAGADWYGGLKQERLMMGKCYHRALQAAHIYGCKSVAVPLIFSGDCHIPRAESIRIAGAVMEEYSQRHPSMEIYLVLYKESIYRLAKGILGWEG